MSQDQPFIWKSSFGGAINWVGVESLGISKVVQTVLALLMESQIWHLPVGSVVLCGEGLEKDNGLCLPFCLGESYLPAPALMPNTSISLYLPLVFQPATLVLELRESECE